MQFLTYELAQEIVERTMKILNSNINVMNNEGVIIGSGDSERIDQLHAGALLVLERGESVEIDHSSVVSMEGSRPGINLPILFNNQVVGVVGITGEPEQIRSYAQLVKMAAELVLEQSFLLERVQWKQRAQSEIVNQLISEEGLDEEVIKERAGLLGINLELPRIAIVMKGSDASIQRLIASIQYEIGREDLIGVTFNNDIIILKAAVVIDTNKDINTFLKRVSKVSSNTILIGSGRLAEHIKQLKSSFDQAKRAILVGSKLRPNRSFYRYEDYQLEIILAKLVEDEDKTIFSYYHQLLDQGRKGELIHTLEAYIREGGELNKTAECLFIHRNTLRYRLDKITELTGKDPRNAKDLMELYMAKLLHDIS
ncbi:CdaR family transcriptional regulator [Terribacillus saccharophilus]|uniref:Sugar diacid utilization regulator n=1 Tax=Terribacillus saccharophilus TaxID=361277 RepID=A0ABX4GUM4_9BACI|nr:sugar diacid recognition domain-containing protein [Terribacillus saccharophilus]PAD34253.1 sugar diacid utilization regulator [Terribacillus saccharophilus]PAD94814.1 sugar diacid utilization regulator [Terribacillus saccharophilus]PAD98563.1 sugar diacid utilization regulator [Terribacillus saccharophilus]